MGRNPLGIYREPHGNWHPLTWISLMLDCSLYGPNPAGLHVTNVLLHAATVVLLFLVLRAMTGRLWPSALVAALFAIHPLRAESVAWVTERKDVLSGLFFVLTLGGLRLLCAAAFFVCPICGRDAFLRAGLALEGNRGDGSLPVAAVGLLAAGTDERHGAAIADRAAPARPTVAAFCPLRLRGRKSSRCWCWRPWRLR